MVIRKMNTLILLAVLTVLAGCTGKSSKRTIHEGPHQSKGESVDTDSVSPAEAQNQVQMTFKKRFEISKRINEGNAEQNLAIALELEKIVLNSTVLSDPELAGRSEFDIVLSMFHRALDKAMDRNMAGVLSSGVLERYEKVALAYCTPQAKGCIRLAMFRGDHLASRILMRIAGTLEPKILEFRAKRLAIQTRIANSTQRQQSDLDALNAENAQYFPMVVRYYRLLQLSYEMNNAQTSPELDQKYVNFARDYFEYFRKLPADQKQHEFNRRHRDTLTLALGHLKNQARGGKLSAEYCKFLRDLNPLDAEMFASMDLDKRSQRSMLSEFIECSSQSGDLKQLIGKFIREQNATAMTNYENDKRAENVVRLKVKDEGYAYASAALSEVPFLYKNLNVELTQRTDLAFFILDRVYYRQIDLNVAMNYWNHTTGLNELEFLKFARNYARLQAAYVLKVTLQNYGRILTDHFKTKGGLSSDYFTEVVTEVNSTSQFDWDELRDRLAFVREFMIKVYDQRLTRGAAPAAAQKEYLAMKEELGNLSNHISMAVTTPMTVPLYYYMAKAQGTIKIHIPWVRSGDQWFDVPATDALAGFLRPDYGRTIPFFKFGNIDSTYDVLGKMHVLDYALRTGIFEFVDFGMLEEDKQLNMPNEVLFFKQATKDLLTNFERNFRSELEKLDIATRNRNFSEAFMGTCEDPMNAPMTFELTDLTMNTFLNDRAMTDSTASIYGASQFIFAWRMYRENLTQMVKVMERHLTADGAADRLSAAKQATKQQVVSNTYAEIERFNKLERQLWDKVLKLDQQIVNKQRDCLVRLVKAEFVRRNELMLANIDYYKDVHAAMTALIQIKDSGATTATQAINAFAARSSGLNSDVATRAVRMLNILRNKYQDAQIDVAKEFNLALSVHNTAGAQDIGFFVSGVPTLEAGGKEIKRLNSFDHERFYQGKWDALVRNRRLMETLTVDSARVNAELGTQYRGVMPIAANTRIPIGSFGELEVNSLYTSNAQKNVAYHADQFKFIRAAMIQFSGAEPNGTQFVSWYSQGGLRIDLVEKRLAWLKDVQELGVLETQDSDLTACPKDIWGRTTPVKDVLGRWLPGAPRLEECKAVRVSSADVMDSYLTVMNLLRITNLERELLEMMDRPGKLEDRIRRYLTYNMEPSTKKWTYFDQFYRTNYTTITAVAADGASWKAVQIEDIRGRKEFTYFRDSLMRNFQDAPALFPMRDSPTQIFRNGIRETIANHLDEIMTFEEAVYDLEERKVQLGDFLIEKTTTPLAGDPLVFGNWRVMQVKQRASGPRAGTPIYLNDESLSAKGWFSTYLETFVIKDTDCMVLPQEGDPDATGNLVALSNKTCRERFNVWKANREQYRQQVRSEFRDAGRGAN